MLKTEALKELARRKADNAKKPRIDNSSLPAGSPMYFYCKECGALADVKDESYTTPVKKLCDPCQDLKDAGIIV